MVPLSRRYKGIDYEDDIMKCKIKTENNMTDATKRKIRTLKLWDIEGGKPVIGGHAPSVREMDWNGSLR